MRDILIVVIMRRGVYTSKIIKNKTHKMNTGIGLRKAHQQELLTLKPSLALIEVHSENYFMEGGESLYYLSAAREHYPLSLHCVGLSLGSTDPINWDHVKKLKQLSQQTNPLFMSDHISWSSLNGVNYHDLLPLPYTEESLLHLSNRIQQVQDYLQRPILIENISSYIQYQHSMIDEWDFVRELALHAHCGILLDINNIYVSSINFKFDAQRYLSAIPSELIQEMHLAGFKKNVFPDENQNLLVDTHNEPVCPDVWELYRSAVSRYGAKPTIIEWDSDLPSLDFLCAEAAKAELIINEVSHAA